MIMSSFQHNFAEVVESSLDFKFKFKLPSGYEKNDLYCLKKSKILIFFGRFFPLAWSQKTEDDILKAFNMAEGLVAEIDFLLSKLSKPDKFDDREVLFLVKIGRASCRERV